MAMKYRFVDLGERRWVCLVTFTGKDKQDLYGIKTEFEEWVKENMPGAYLYRGKNLQFGQLEQHYELRSGNTADRTLFGLRWNKDSE